MYLALNAGYNNIGKRVRLIFGTCLHIRDKELLIGMANYFLEQLRLRPNNNLHKYIYDSEERQTCLLQIKNYSDIVNKIIPFFYKYPLLGIKNLDFADFKKVAELMKNKEHLTYEGITKIIKIVERMNLDRSY